MKINLESSFLDAKDIVWSKERLWEEISWIFTNCNLKFGINRPGEIKKYFAQEFNRLGWADRVCIQNKSNLTISFLKSRTGLCLQFGNVARTYSDILKLSFLHKKGIVDLGIIFVPGYRESKLLGANYANFERLSREVEIYQEIICTPLLILGVTN